MEPKKKSVGKFDYTRKNEKYKAAMQASWYNNRKKVVRIIWYGGGKFVIHDRKMQTDVGFA